MLNKEFLKLATSENIYGIFNVSVEASMKGYKKMGWSYLPGFERLINIPNPFQMTSRLIKYYTKRRMNKQEYLNEISDNIPCNEIELDNLLEYRNRELSNKKLPFCYYDNQTFINRLSNVFAGYKYLYFDNSLVIYKLIIKKSIFKGILIGDILFTDSSTFKYKAILKELTKKENPDFFVTYISKKHPNYRLFKKNHFFSILNKEMNFGTRIINKSSIDHFGDYVWQTTILDIDTF